jgi:hypothetical protein
MLNFQDILVAGVPLLLVVIGLVEWVKKINVPSNALPFVSMGIGLILGSGYQVAENGVPLDFAGWFAVIVFGLAIGLVASGLFDAAKNIVKS